MSHLQVDSVSDAVDTTVVATQEALDNMDITDLDSVLDNTQLIVEGATDGLAGTTTIINRGRKCKW